jgi:hypothetical protein
MNLRVSLALLGCLAALGLFGGALGRAADDPLSYDDPGMHFRPPDGWERVPIASNGTAPGLDQPLAIYIFHRGKIDQRLVTIAAESYDGTLEVFERQHESELRNTVDGTFIDKHTAVTLENGMPAMWVQSSTSGDVGKYTRRYEYLIFDSKRAIVVGYTGRQGDFDEKEAKAALASLYVVAFPKPRST